jgi:hypothetical protein
VKIGIATGFAALTLATGCAGTTHQVVPTGSATSLQRMAHRLKTPAGRKLYALRKHTPELVFGSIKIGGGISPVSLARAPKRQR